MGKVGRGGYRWAMVDVGSAFADAIAARRAASATCERSRAVASQARESTERSRDLRASSRRILSRRLVLLTRIADAGLVASPVIEGSVVRLAGLVGRDPAIEQAKTILAERYAVSRRDAFEILRHLSSRRNQKVRIVARHLATNGSINDPGRSDANNGDDRALTPTGAARPQDT